MTMSPNDTQPGFFQQLSTFIDTLPQQPHYIQYSPQSPPKPLLKDYLHHYGIDACTLNPHYEHAIWRSDISTQNGAHCYTVVQQCWRPSQIRGTLLIAHGYMDHTGLYGRVIQWALAHGYCVLGFDLPGHGLSSGARASIDNFNDYSDIFTQIICESTAQNLIQAPFYAIGQSTGCAVICNNLLREKDPVIMLEHAFLLAPLVRIHGWPLLRWVYFVLRPFIPSIKRSFMASSHDEDFTAFLQHQDPLQTTRIPLKWLGAMDQWYLYIKKTTHSHPQPMTIIQGTGDMTVDWRYNIDQLKRCFPKSQTHRIKGAKHHLVKEADPYWLSVEAILSDHLTSEGT